MGAIAAINNSGGIYATHWPKHIPSNQIDEFMNDEPLGDATTLKKCIDGMSFSVNCQKDDHYVAKIMSSHRTLRGSGTPSNTLSQFCITIMQNIGLIM